MHRLALEIIMIHVRKKIFIETEEVYVAASLQFVGLIPVVIGFDKDVKNLVLLSEFKSFTCKSAHLLTQDDVNSIGTLSFIQYLDHILLDPWLLILSFGKFSMLIKFIPIQRR